MGRQPVRLAIVGANRGSGISRVLQSFEDRVRLTAVCDKNEELLKPWQERCPDVRTYGDFHRLLEDPFVDAVYIASPMHLHARQSIEALLAGKHVLCEVPAAQTLEDAWELVETVERTGLHYMMAENYCFSRSALAVKSMAEQGLFGEITYMEGGYIHDCRHLVHGPDDSLTWRGELHRAFNGMNYPTHSLGPVSQWIGSSRPDGDELKSIAVFVSKARSLQRYFDERYGSSHPGARAGYWRQGDSAVAVVQTRKDVLITLRVDWTSARPPNSTHYAVQGTEGAYVSGRYEGEDDLIWLQRRSPKAEDGQPVTWEPLKRYQPELDHPLWKRWGHEASRFRHGGGDFLVFAEFFSAIAEDRAPDVNVYDAAAWSSVFALSMESVAAGGKTIPFPDFKRRNKG
ncbi:Gfo/Idh/MocA family protein [Paenibacillus tyrfis]|uniref:Gfo/Idh/MocA family protein n=1 Tax=Paenibacillus tyrfis TaxID=1501230 RepID=UPI000B58BD91|nr:Gfo/Idh/MocA family oxidoreductase [Paenibacillus tyrfis]